MALLNVFRQAYPLQSYRLSLYRDLFFAFFLSLFLLVFRPFGLEVYSYEESYVMIGYGAITLLTTVLNDYLGYQHFPAFFRETNWTVGKQLAWSGWQLICLGLTCFVYAALIKAFPWTLLGFLKVQLYVLLCAIVPISLFTLLRQNYMLKRNSREANQLEVDLSQQVPQPNETVEQAICFTGENRNEKLEMLPSQLICISAQDNYVEFVFLQAGHTKRALLRNTLSKIDEQLNGHSQFFRCHRSYLINLEKIRMVKGNAQGYVLKMEEFEPLIPVSRARGQALHQAIQA
ncbi:LytR/AlgR family response regulator transcription factor [Spirosoma panaciterrae]|uniref:LytR/AlgR family response regulator transcription factor n=1 Tax=Spirosoma panaciterrae TaxID=496058 RepID=UPI00036B8FC0|nr:LytTR family DNA-binding domain-containing protein [Spirosoma panaciterrae]